MLVDSLNNRLYKRMQQTIMDFHAKEISLRKLIMDLEGLHNLLENPDESWVRKFYEIWPSLEEVYAIALDGRKGIIDDDDILIIDRLLKSMSELLDKTIIEGQQDLGNMN